MASYASVADLLDVVAPGVTPGELDNAWESELGGIDSRLDAVARLGLGWAGALEWAELSGAASRRAIYTSGTAIAVGQAAQDRSILSTIIPIAYSAPFVVGAGAALASAAPAEVSVFDSISNWFGNALESAGNWFSADQVVDLGTDLGGLGDLGEEVFSEALTDIGQDLGGEGIGEWARTGLPGQIFTEGGMQLPEGMTPVSGSGAWLSRMIGAAGPMVGTTAARVGGTMASGAATMTLGAVFGAVRGAAAFTLNGIRGTIPQLWKYTRKFGPMAVAQALGISVGALGTMLLQNPERPRRRSRGISARDVRTTKRVVRFVKRIEHDVGFRHHHHRKH